MDVLLRERDFDAGFSELPVHREVELGLRLDEVFDTPDMRPQGESECAVPEGIEGDERFRIFQYPFVFTGHFKQQLSRQLGIRPVGDPDGDIDPQDAVAERPVDELPGDEFLVRDNEARGC